LLAAKMVPDGSWRALFIAGGTLPILAAAVMFFFMPESPRFLAACPTRSRSLADLLNRIDGSERFGSGDSFVLNVPIARASSGVRAVFSPDLRVDTVITSLVFLANIFAIYAFFNWSPLVLTSMGFRFDEAVRSTLVFNVAGIAGSLAVAATIARWGSRAPLAICSAAGGLTLIGLSFLPRGESMSLLAGIAIAGATVSAVQVGMYAVAANVYPTPCRSAGIGLALGVGRMGGILSAFAGSLLLAYAGAAGFFGAVGAVMLVTVAAILALRGHVARPRSRNLQPTKLGGN
jgi:AAHS family 4-hydroxybenzoate transporter-like MFS transporter